MGELTVATLNLRGVHDQWWRREPLVVRELAAMRPDLICFQEAATWCFQARWLAWRISRASGDAYRVCQARKRGWEGALEGIATLARIPFGRTDKLALGGGRVALRSRLARIEGLAVVNTHLEHQPRASSVRADQADRIARWAAADPGAAVITGDLNDVPESAALGALRGRFRSVFDGLNPLAGTWPAWEPRRTVDYILVSPEVEVLAAGTCLATAFNGVWPSDHIGLWARLRL